MTEFVSKMPLGTKAAAAGYFSGWIGFSAICWGNFSTNLYNAEGICFENWPLSIAIGFIAPGGCIVLESLLTTGKNCVQKGRNKKCLSIFTVMLWLSWLAVSGILSNPNSPTDINADLAMILSTVQFYLQIGCEAMTASCFLFLFKETMERYAEEIVKTRPLVEAYQKELKPILVEHKKAQKAHSKDMGELESMNSELELYQTECGDNYRNILDLFNDPEKNN